VTVGLDKWWLLDHGDVGCASTVAGVQFDLVVTDASVDVEQCCNRNRCTALVNLRTSNAYRAALSFNILQLFTLLTCHVAGRLLVLACHTGSSINTLAGDAFIKLPGLAEFLVSAFVFAHLWYTLAAFIRTFLHVEDVSCWTGGDSADL